MKMFLIIYANQYKFKKGRSQNKNFLVTKATSSHKLTHIRRFSESGRDSGREGGERVRESGRKRGNMRGSS